MERRGILLLDDGSVGGGSDGEGAFDGVRQDGCVVNGHVDADGASGAVVWGPGGGDGVAAGGCSPKKWCDDARDG